MKPQRDFIRKVRCVLMIMLLMFVSFYAGRTSMGVRAYDWDGLVYSINNLSGDAAGNVRVSQVNEKNINSNVPLTADFSQYSKNSSDINKIDNKLSGLTATAENVVEGLTFVGSDGTLQTGTLDINSIYEAIDFSKMVTTSTTANQWSKAATIDCGNNAVYGTGLSVSASAPSISGSNARYCSINVYGRKESTDDWSHIWGSGTIYTGGGNTVSYSANLGTVSGYRYFQITWTNHAYVDNMNATLNVAYFAE